MQTVLTSNKPEKQVQWLKELISRVSSTVLVTVKLVLMTLKLRNSELGFLLHTLARHCDVTLTCFAPTCGDVASHSQQLRVLRPLRSGREAENNL